MSLKTQPVLPHIYKYFHDIISYLKLNITGVFLNVFVRQTNS